MILKLDHTKKKEAERIRAVFQVSYAVEAKLLNAADFPPLKRTLKGFLESRNDFFGDQTDNFLKAVVEIKRHKKAVHIQSLVVHPDYFRKGIASELLRFVLTAYKTELFTVETGLANGPATQLYLSFGFVKTKEWDTNHGIRKIAFELRGNQTSY